MNPAQGGEDAWEEKHTMRLSVCLAIASNLGVGRAFKETVWVTVGEQAVEAEIG